MGGDSREKERKTEVDQDEDEFNTDSYAATPDGRKPWRGSASDTADFLIVHETILSPAEPPLGLDPEKLAMIRERIESGAYSVVPDRVAQAMVRVVEEAHEKNSDDDLPEESVD